LNRGICLHPCALPRRFGLAGPPPPRLLADRRVTPPSPPLEATVVLVVRLPSSWCRPRRDWSTPTRFRCRAGEPPPGTAASPHRRLPCSAAAACARLGPPIPQPTARMRSNLTGQTKPPVNPPLSSRVEPRPMDLDPMDQIRPFSFPRAILFKRP
jgi:hypothetical protein